MPQSGRKKGSDLVSLRSLITCSVTGRGQLFGDSKIQNSRTALGHALQISSYRTALGHASKKSLSSRTALRHASTSYRTALRHASNEAGYSGIQKFKVLELP